jgi:hypothetical protein
MDSPRENKPITLRQIIHNIKNLLQLSAEEKEFIKTLTNNEKMEIILEYDKILQALVDVYAEL